LNRIAAASDALAAADVDVVVHAAAAMGGGAPVLFLNNVVALRRFLDVLQKLPSPPRRFVHVSSFGVYGTGHLRGGDTLDETCPLDPAPHLRDPYSYSKIAQEQVVWEAHAAGRLPLVVIWPGVIYGPGRGSLSNRIGLRVGRLMVRMGGGQQLPYTYVDNVAAAVALAASVPGIEGQAFNVLDDDLPRAKAVLKQYRREVERLRVVPVPYWAIRPLSGACEWYNRWSEGQLPAVLTRYKSMAAWKRLKYTNAKAKSVLGWKPSVSFVDGLRLSHDAACKELEAKKRQAASAA
jgi:nucleoside-diphosphate-sugar epimerase